MNIPPPSAVDAQRLLTNQQEAELVRMSWIKKMDIAPVPEQYRYPFALAMFQQNFERMVIASKFGAAIMGALIVVVDILNLPGIAAEYFGQALPIHVSFFIALLCGYLVGERLNRSATRSTPLWLFFAWGTFFRGSYTILAYWMLYHIGQVGGSMSGAYAVFVSLITAGLYADKRYTFILAIANAAVYTGVVLATQHSTQAITDNLFNGYCILAVATFSSSILYHSFRQEFTATKQIEEERRKAQELNTQLSDANEEISKQMEMLNEQSREIEIANTALQEKSIELERQRDTADDLLHNILPRPIAQRLKSGERSIADKFDSVTVLFADIVGFTQIASTHSAADIVFMLNRVFSAFDIFSEQYHLEKIKTIGDAYMIVGGVPEPREDHCAAVARMALEILSTIELLNKTMDVPLSVRIGIHTGSVVAGVIGQKKFSYDLWGDTVNTASRMESHGEAGRIHVTEEVYRALRKSHLSLDIGHLSIVESAPMINDKATNDQATNALSPNDQFTFEERGEIEVKGKGVMRTWFLTGAR